MGAAVVNLDEAADAAATIVRAAGGLAAQYYRERKGLRIEAKGLQDFVSEADRACEDLIVSALEREFPGSAFLGEERGVKGQGDVVWVIDPIDGTANFLTGISHWCVSVGLMVRGEPVIGLIYDPIGEEFFSAVKGRGALLNGAPISVTGRADIAHARVCIGFSYRQPVAGHVRDVETLLAGGIQYLRLGSGALGVAYAAAGRFDAYWERHINVWDVLAALVIVTEAGGRTNDFLAGDAIRKGNRIIASTPALFEDLSRLLR